MFSGLLFSVPTSSSQYDSGSSNPDISSPPPPITEKTEKEIHDEIQSIFRQITASVTFLPQLDGHCTFNVLVYADADSDVPLEWGDSDAKDVRDAEKVQLRSFSTSSHRVDTLVSYRYVFCRFALLWSCFSFRFRFTFSFYLYFWTF